MGCEGSARPSARRPPPPTAAQPAQSRRISIRGDGEIRCRPSGEGAPRLLRAPDAPAPVTEQHGEPRAHLFAIQAALEIATDGEGNRAGLLRNDNGDGVVLFGDAERCAMTGAEIAGDARGARR